MTLDRKEDGVMELYSAFGFTVTLCVSVCVCVCSGVCVGGRVFLCGFMFPNTAQEKKK